MKILNRFGYRVTLTGVTVCIGLMLPSSPSRRPPCPCGCSFSPLFMLGMAMSTQFTAMNSITLGDLSTEDASTGNGLLSVTQQLSISFGVASSTVVLRFYNSFASGTLLDHFHYTFITIGGITMMAAFVFMLLRKDDGDSLLPGRKKPVFETTSSPTPRNPLTIHVERKAAGTRREPYWRISPYLAVQRRRVCRVSGTEPRLYHRPQKGAPSVHGERLQQEVGGNGYSVSAYSSMVCLTRARSPFRASMSDSCIMHAGHPVATTSAPCGNDAVTLLLADLLRNVVVGQREAAAATAAAIRLHHLHQFAVLVHVDKLTRPAC